MDRLMGFLMMVAGVSLFCNPRQLQPFYVLPVRSRSGQISGVGLFIVGLLLLLYGVKQ